MEWNLSPYNKNFALYFMGADSYKMVASSHWFSESAIIMFPIGHTCDH